MNMNGISNVISIVIVSFMGVELLIMAASFIVAMKEEKDVRNEIK